MSLGEFETGVQTMEITLENIDILRVRAGLSYAEARDVLVAAEGDVLEALVRAEQMSKDAHGPGAATPLDGKASEIVDKVKEIWAKGADTKVKIVRGDQTLFDMPLTAGLVGTLLAPQFALAGALVAYASKCSIEIEKAAEHGEAPEVPSCSPCGGDAPCQCGDEQQDKGPETWS